jgi:hypothetical protein
MTLKWRSRPVRGGSATTHVEVSKVNGTNTLIGNRMRLASWTAGDGSRIDVETDRLRAGVYVRRTPCGERCGVHPPAEQGWATPGDDFGLQLRIAALASRMLDACGYLVLAALRRAECGVAT